MLITTNINNNVINCTSIGDNLKMTILTPCHTQLEHHSIIPKGHGFDFQFTLKNLVLYVTNLNGIILIFSLFPAFKVFKIQFCFYNEWVLNFVKNFIFYNLGMFLVLFCYVSSIIPLLLSMNSINLNIFRILKLCSIFPVLATCYIYT